VSEAEPPAEGGRAWKRGGVWGLAAILLVYLGLAVGSAARKSVTVDELGHLPAGLYFLQTGDARYATLNPPLVNALSAVPVLFLELERERPAPSEDVFSFWANGYHFHEMHRPDYRRMFEVARWVQIGIVAALGALVFFWARQLAPEAPALAGILAAGFVCFSPNVLAQARLVGTDTGTAFFVALALYALRDMLRTAERESVLFCGVALGLAQLTKFYGLLLYPSFLGIAIAWHALSAEPRPNRRRMLIQLATAFALSLLMLNTGYLWQEFGASLSAQSLQSPTLVAMKESILGGVPLPLPGAYVRAFDGQLVEIGSKIPSFLFGETFEGGRWYYYLAVLAVKTPVGLFIAFGLAMFLVATRVGISRREAVLLLAYPITLFVLLSLSSGRQLGARALLSAVPLVWVWAAASIARTWPERWPAVVAGLGLAATLFGSLWAYPDYLSYFNAFVGKDEGYRYVSDANVDIGQDLVQLGEFLEGQEEERVQLLYFGSVDPALYGIEYEIPEARMKPGLLAISVSLYRMSYLMYERGKLRSVGPVDPSVLGEPIARIGGSIHVFRVGR
jgi:hypothetical protein